MGPFHTILCAKIKGGQFFALKSAQSKHLDACGFVNSSHRWADGRYAVLEYFSMQDDNGSFRPSRM